VRLGVCGRRGSESSGGSGSGFGLGVLLHLGPWRLGLVGVGARARRVAEREGTLVAARARCPASGGTSVASVAGTSVYWRSA
jgi:hypothetical protein